MFIKISQNSQKNNCVRVSFLIKLQASGLIEKEAMTQVFSCEFGMNTFFIVHLWWLLLKVEITHRLKVKYDEFKLPLSLSSRMRLRCR